MVNVFGLLGVAVKLKGIRWTWGILNPVIRLLSERSGLKI